MRCAYGDRGRAKRTATCICSMPAYTDWLLITEHLRAKHMGPRKLEQNILQLRSAPREKTAIDTGPGELVAPYATYPKGLRRW